MPTIWKIQNKRAAASPGRFSHFNRCHQWIRGMGPQPETPSHQRDAVASIQAMRAFAVLWVVVDHAFPRALPGGFVGVDIFFVISGFLITSHLVRQIGDGSFSAIGFYLRRARRLLPAALLVLTVTTGATLTVLPPAWQASTLGGIAAAAIYGINWWLAGHAVNYFAGDGMTSPVNHFWSLSVEEQFYLIWPALMLAGLEVARRRPGKGRDRVIGPIAAMLVAVVVLSFSAALFEMSRDRAAAYLVTQGRAWEFAIGGLAALIAPVAARRNGSVVRPILFILSWMVLVASGWVLAPASHVPGVDIVPVVMATALLLAVGDDHRMALADQMIAVRPVQWLGDISYSLYLWHWPLLVMAPFALRVDSVNTLQVLAVLALCLVLSDLTWRLVENRFRSGPPTRPKLKLMTWLSASAALAGLAFGLAGTQAARSERVAQQLYDLSQAPDRCFGAHAVRPESNCPDKHRLMKADFALQNWESQKVWVPNGTACQNPPGDAALAPCSWGVADNRAQRRIALLGDSHIGMWAAAIEPFAEAEGLRFTMYSASSCPATDDENSSAFYLTPERRLSCLTWRRAAVAAILSDPAIDTVFVSGNVYNQKVWTGQGWVEDDGSGFAALWQRMISAGKRVVVIDDVPMLRRKLPECLARPHPDNDPCSRPASEVPETVFARAVARMPKGSVTFVPLRDVFCDADLCHSVIGGIPAYMDSDHISAPMARSLSDRIRSALLPQTKVEAQ